MLTAIESGWQGTRLQAVLGAIGGSEELQATDTATLRQDVVLFKASATGMMSVLDDCVATMMKREEVRAAARLQRPRWRWR
jgi:hypothetical protein